MKDVAHQDIRLANIMIPKHGIPAAVLIDFSFSRIEEGTFHKTLGGRRDRGTFLNLMFSSERTKSFAEQWCMGNRNDPLLDGMFIPEEGFDKYQRRIEEADEAKKAGKRNLLD
jgi:serine/threonine protein kinase